MGTTESSPEIPEARRPSEQPASINASHIEFKPDTPPESPNPSSPMSRASYTVSGACTPVRAAANSRTRATFDKRSNAGMDFVQVDAADLLSKEQMDEKFAEIVVSVS